MGTKAKALEIFSKYYEQWESNPQRMESGYDYEATYVAMMEKVGHEVLQLSVGEVPKDKNPKKNSTPDLGK